jgi:CRISPR-associated protein Cmr6
MAHGDRRRSDSDRRGSARPSRGRVPTREGVSPSLRRPLYNKAARATLDGKVSNAGLWYDKFCDGWKSDWTGFAGDSGKRDWIGRIANFGARVSPKTVGDRALVEEAAARLDNLVKALKGQTFRRTTAWRFVTGLGRSHPVENGFAWHHILGTPYLPGSSLKGLARSYARDWEGLSAEDVEPFSVRDPKRP